MFKTKLQKNNLTVKPRKSLCWLIRTKSTKLTSFRKNFYYSCLICVISLKKVIKKNKVNEYNWNVLYINQYSGIKVIENKIPSFIQKYVLRIK